MEDTTEPIKCTVVGDVQVGKTCMLMAYKDEGRGLEDRFIPSILDKFSTIIELDGQRILLDLVDTGGEEDFDRLRYSEAYPNTNVVLICFSVTNRESFDNVRTKWYREVTHFCPKRPIILVGTMLDVRKGREVKGESDQDGLTVVTRDEGTQMQTEIGAFAYLECSAVRQIGLNEVFIQSVRAVLHKRETVKSESKKDSCLLS